MNRRSLRALFPNATRPARGRRACRPWGEPLDVRAVPASLPTGFTEAAVASGLTAPTAMEFSPEGHLFVAEQAGTLEVFRDGSRLQSDFFVDDPLTVDATAERGLLGIAFDPNYATNHFVYVYYTATTPTAHNRLSRFTADADGELALADSERILLELDPLTAANHNGGAIHFGPDGKLYVAVGENANGENAQSLDNLLGKILRLNADGTIPVDNPFYTQAEGNNRAIWALGLRNPFTFTFQPGTGRMFINDVGQTAFEEINVGLPGANYGWPATEGPTTDTSFESPFYSYGRSEGQAITGGAFYNPDEEQFPDDYAGDYFFADFVSSWIRRIDPATGVVTSFATSAANPVDLRVGADGSLYYLARGSGRVFQVRFREGQGQQGPSISQQPEGRTVPEGRPVTFSVVASGSAPLSYQWQRNGVDIAGATGASHTFTATAADSGATFRVVVSNAFFSLPSAAATLTVTVTSVPPVDPPPTVPAPAPQPIPSGPIASPSPPVAEAPVPSLPDPPRNNARLRRLARRQARLRRFLARQQRLGLRRLIAPGVVRSPRGA